VALYRQALHTVIPSATAQSSATISPHGTARPTAHAPSLVRGRPGGGTWLHLCTISLWVSWTTHDAWDASAWPALHAWTIHATDALSTRLAAPQRSTNVCSKHGSDAPSASVHASSPTWPISSSQWRRPTPAYAHDAYSIPRPSILSPKSSTAARSALPNDDASTIERAAPIRGWCCSASTDGRTCINCHGSVPQRWECRGLHFISFSRDFVYLSSLPSMLLDSGMQCDDCDPTVTGCV